MTVLSLSFSVGKTAGKIVSEYDMRWLEKLIGPAARSGTRE
jgi:hypothetical protein